LAIATFAFGITAAVAGFVAGMEHRPALIAGYFVFALLAIISAFLVQVRDAVDTETTTTTRLVWIGLLAPALSFCWAGWLDPGVSHVRTSAAYTQVSGQLCQIGVALHAYHDVKGHLPPPAIKDSQGRPLLSWRVAFLPYIEYGELYKKFRLDEPWDSPHNFALLDQMPPMFKSIYLSEPDAENHTRIQALVGPGTAFDDREFPITFKKNFPDGLHATILLVESARPVPWTKPEDVAYDPDGPFPELGGETWKSVPLFGPKRVRGFFVLMANGDRRYLEYPVDEAQLRNAFLRNDGKGWRPR